MPPKNNTTSEQERKGVSNSRRAYYLKNKERLIAGSREWALANKERQRENLRRWRENNPDRVREINKRWQSANRDKVNAHREKHKRKYILDDLSRQKVAAEVAAGRLIRQPCEVCGADKTHAHHDDYNFPLAIRWLCRKHHVEWHRHNKPVRRTA